MINTCTKNASEIVEEIEKANKEVEDLLNEVEELEVSIQKHSGRVQRVQEIGNQYINKVRILFFLISLIFCLKD